MATMRSDSLTRSSARSANTSRPRPARRRPPAPESRRSRAPPARRRRACRAAAPRARARGRPARPSRRPGGDLDVGAHRRQHVQRAGARRVEADVLDGDVAARHRRGRHEQERGRRQVARDDDRAARSRPFQPSGSTLDRAAAASTAIGAPIDAQHPLGVIARAARLAQRGRALGLQPGEHQRALELRARDRQVVADAGQRAAAHAQRREDVAGPRGSARPSIVAPIRRSGSATRRIGRRVSEASPASSVSNGRPASSPISRRIVVPELPQSIGPAGAVQAREPDALDPRLVAGEHAPRPARAAPPRSTGCRRPGRARSPRPRRRQRAEQQRPVRDRLVAGHPAGPAQRARAADAQQRVPPSRYSYMSRRLLPVRERLEQREQLLGEALALARRRCGGGRGRASPRPPSDRPSNTGARPSSITMRCCASAARRRPRRAPPSRRARRRRTPPRLQVQIVAEVQPRAHPPQLGRQLEHPGGARAHAVGHRDRKRHRRPMLIRAQRAAQLAQRAAARVGTIPHAASIAAAHGIRSP